MVVICEVYSCVNSLLCNAFIMEETLGGNYSTIVDAHNLSLEYC